MRFYRLLACAAACVALLTGCANRPPVPDWQMDAKGASERFVKAYAAGNSRVETLEFAKALSALASTGRPDLLARLELLRCATRVASLVFEPCVGFEALRADALPAERAYADYLAGQLAAGDAALLPPAQQSVASAAPAAQVAALQNVDEPLSRLVAAGVLLRRGQASPAVLVQAAETASAQGWRRPLLAWLGAQAWRAEQAGDALEAARLRRRMDLATAAAAP
ncbi:MAG: hypothetical protein RLZZ03_466 [Pseudomonadota bacterium]|jgi:hypothetical protein